MINNRFGTPCFYVTTSRFRNYHRLVSAESHIPSNTRYHVSTGGFITLRHNEVRDVTAEMLAEVCKDVRTEPPLAAVSGERFVYKTAVVGDDARLNISARSFWVFVDIRVFNPTAKRYSNQTLINAHRTNEKEKKRAYNERVKEIEHGTFTPFGIFVLRRNG